MTEFIYGPPSSGKTTLLYTKIKASLGQKKDVFLIVPDQEALDAEAALVRFCRGVPTVRLRVCGFSRLADEVFRKYGGISYNYVDKTGQTLAMFLAVCSVSPALRVYGRTPPSDRALLSSVLSAVKELKRQGITAKELEDAANVVESKQLCDKLGDIELLMPAYENILKNSGDDPDDELGRMYRVLAQNGGMAGCDVFIDSFISYTGVQLKLIELFIKTADSVTLTVGMPGPGCESELLSPLRETEKRLSAIASRYGKPTRTTLSGTYAAPCIAALEQGLRLRKKSDIDPGESIRFFRAENSFEEAELVAADIKKRLRGGARCREIAILTADSKAFRGITDAALEKYGIPYFISGRDDAKQKALFRLILSALHICVNDFRTKDVCAYIKTGLLNVPSDPLDMFDNYIKNRDIRGVKKFSEDFTGSPYSFGAPGADDEKAIEYLNAVNETRRAVITPLYDLYTELHDCGDAKSISTAIVRLLSRIGITETLAKMMEYSKAAGEAAEAEEISQLWGVFTSVTTQLVAVCGELPMNADQYLKLFETVLSDTDIGKIPTSTDQVTVGDAGMLRVRGIKHVYLIGCNEGEFPLSASESGVWSDADRKQLTDAGLELEGSLDRENDRQQYDFYRAAVCASETVTFCYSVSSPGGAEKYPCRILKDVLRVFPDIKTTSGLSIYDIAGSRRAAFEFYAENRGTKEGGMIKKLLSEDAEWAERAKMLDIPITEKHEKLDPVTIADVIPRNFALSPSRLSTFTGCAFSHCCQYFLKLDGQNPVTFDAAEFGSFVHYVLKRLIDDLMRGDITTAPDDKELDSAIEKYIYEYCRTILRTDPSADGMGAFRASLKKLKKCTEKAARDVLAELAAGKFKPVSTELKISGATGLPPYMIKLPDGRQTYLTGTIDRVDAYEKDGKTYIKLVDYKTGTVKFDLSEALAADKSVQLFAYMLTVCTAAGRFEHPTPAALFYMETTPSYPTLSGSGQEPEAKRLNRGGIALLTDEVREALDPGMDKKGGEIYKIATGSMIFEADEAMTAVFEEVKAAISDAARRMCEGDASVTDKETKPPCKYCQYITVCRYTAKKNVR